MVNQIYPNNPFSSDQFIDIDIFSASKIYGKRDLSFFLLLFVFFDLDIFNFLFRTLKCLFQIL